MVKHVVFDMGGVLINNPFDAYLNARVSDADDRVLLMRELFRSVEWIRMDRGVMDEAAVAESVGKRVPERLHETVRTLIDNWYQTASPIAGVEAIVRRLKAAGYGLYILSNASTKFHGFDEKLPAIECFDGRFVSCDVHFVKPEPAIYQTFLKQYGLRAEECVFIDDVNANVEGAVNVGLNGIVFFGDAKRLEAQLNALGLRF